MRTLRVLLTPVPATKTIDILGALVTDFAHARKMSSGWLVTGIGAYLCCIFPSATSSCATTHL